MIVRPAVPDDFSPWFVLVESVVGEDLWLGRQSPPERDEMREQFDLFTTDEDHGLLVAYSEGTEGIVGAIGLYQRRGIAGFGMEVAAASRRRGIGGALLDGALSWACAKQCHKISIEVWPHNEAAIALYLRHGYSVEDRLKRQYRRRNEQLWDSIQMGLVLDADSDGSSHPDAAQVFSP